LANQCKIKHFDEKTNSTSQHDGFGRWSFEPNGATRMLTYMVDNKEIKKWYW
jgi:hypothetical protein